MSMLHLRSTVDVRSLLPEVDIRTLMPEVDTRYITIITIIMRAIVFSGQVRRLFELT